MERLEEVTRSPGNRGVNISGAIIIGFNTFRKYKSCQVTTIGRQGAIYWRRQWKADGENVQGHQSVSSGGGQESFGNISWIVRINGKWGLGISFLNLRSLQGMKR